MKVFVLGGYGDVGFAAIKLLAASDLLTEITVAERSLERAENTAKEIGERDIAAYADGTDEGKASAPRPFPALDVTMAPQEPQLRVGGVSPSGAMAWQGGQLISRSTYRRTLCDTEARGSQRDTV
jgi:hypothetical protein